MMIKAGGYSGMSRIDRLRGVSLVWVSMLLLMGQSVDANTLRGFNFLQDRQTTLDSSRVCLSLKKLQKTGANSIILIPFMKQESQRAVTPSLAENVTDGQLIAGIREAKRQGLHVIVKPQLLVSGSWAGEIKLMTDKDERIWFKRYIEHIIHYARIAEKNQADAFVVGTEMKQLRKSKYWREVIQAVRGHFRGRITYAAHGLEGVVEFPYWGLLDSIGVTLYPVFPEKANAGQVLAVTDRLMDELRTITRKYTDKAVWILEIGMPSAEGWEPHPWDWQKLRDEKPRADSQMQAVIIKEWLTSVDRPWIDGVWIWQWSSSPQAGGEDDADYTVQNKPAELMIQAVWQGAKLISNDEVRPCEN